MSAPVLDYLGHPCELHRARERFSEAVEDAHKSERRELECRIARGLHEAVDRQEIIYSAIEAALASLVESTDTDCVKAILTMAQAYVVESSNQLFDLAGQVVAMLDSVPAVTGAARTVEVAPDVVAAAAPTGVGIATDLLRHLRSIDDADLDEVTRTRHAAECFEVAVDVARSDAARWPDFAKAISYVLRTSVGGCALEADFDLATLVEGLDETPDRQPASRRPPSPRRRAAARSRSQT